MAALGRIQLFAVNLNERQERRIVPLIEGMVLGIIVGLGRAEVVHRLHQFTFKYRGALLIPGAKLICGLKVLRKAPKT